MNSSPSRLRLVLLTTIAVFVGAIAICQVFEWLGFPEQNQVQLIRKMAGWNPRFMLTVAWILLATPVIEESLFRGLLFRLPSRLLSGDGSPRFFAFGLPLFLSLVSSALFSFAHYVDFGAALEGRGLALLPVSNAFLALFFVGLSWCWLYHRTRSLWCSMLSHSLFNAVNLVLALTVPA